MRKVSQIGDDSIFAEYGKHYLSFKFQWNTRVLSVHTNTFSFYIVIEATRKTETNIVVKTQQGDNVTNFGRLIISSRERHVIEQGYNCAA